MFGHDNICTGLQNSTLEWVRGQGYTFDHVRVSVGGGQNLSASSRPPCTAQGQDFFLGGGSDDKETIEKSL